jgi:hypothetical protein
MQTCRELLYSDFREVAPGSLDKLAAALNEHSGQELQQGAAASLQTQTKAHLRRSTPHVGWNMPAWSENQDSNDLINQTTARVPSASNPERRQALQLCIETGKFTLELGELDFD